MPLEILRRHRQSLEGAFWAAVVLGAFVLMLRAMHPGSAFG